MGGLVTSKQDLSERFNGDGVAASRPSEQNLEEENGLWARDSGGGEEAETAAKTGGVAGEG